MELSKPTFVDHIYDFNLVAGLLQKGYDDYLESSFQIEEAMEGFKCPVLMRTMGLPETIDTTPKYFSRFLVESAIKEHGSPLSDVDRLDKACDAVVFAIGSMAKLGLDPDQINRAMRAVTNANLQKLTMPKDAQGKLMKPDNFIGPEVLLQSILDEREPEKC